MLGLSLRSQLFFTAALCLAGHASVCFGHEPPASGVSADAQELQDVVVTGTRERNLEASESPSTIIVLGDGELQAASASPDLMNALAQLVPSLTVQAYGEDMAGQTLLAKLKGLSPNHVLVLVNGHRRHTTANLAVDIGSPYQGGAGVDLNFIPIGAIDHIEVLTDGAAAQYGSDAIAGVINIILKKQSSGGAVDSTYGNYMRGGGNTGDLAANAGLQPADDSYFNATAESHNHGHSDVGAVDERLINPATLSTYPDSNVTHVPGYPNLSLIEGDAEYHLKLAEFNSGFPVGGGEFYSFGTYGSKHAASFEFYRLPSEVQFTDPATGITSYPLSYGFEPQEATRETDFSLTTGVRGTVADFQADLASTYGGDRLGLYTLNSANAGIYQGGALTASDFYDGELGATQWVTSLDLNRDLDLGAAHPLNFAFGAEYRRDTFDIHAGTPSSYLAGGAQSYPGFSPTDAGGHSRQNQAAYIDLAGKPTERLQVDAAARAEHFSDYGRSIVAKFSGRWDFTSALALRGTVSNGFRAPTLAEEYYSSTNVGPTTAFVQLPPNSPGGKLLGLGNGLEPEKSVNFSMGLVYRPSTSLDLTVDLYDITINNRIVGSGQLVGSNFGAVQSPTVNAAIAANGSQLDPAVAATGLTGINVFTNGVDTRTLGSDVSLDYTAAYEFGRVDYSVGATFNETKITRVRATPAQLGGESLFDATALSDVTTASPKYIANLGVTWSYGKTSVHFLEKIYGPSADFENDDGDNPTGHLEYFKSTIGVTPITNIGVAYDITQRLRLSLGANNAFNRYPPRLNATLLAHADNFAYGDVLGVVRYPLFSPFGINGGFYFAKVVFSF